MRLFAAINLHDQAREAVAEIAEVVRAALPAYRYELPEKYHLTVAFLGNVDDGLLPQIESALSAAAGAATPFTITLDTVDAFPSAARPRVVYVGSERPQAPFAALAHDVRDRLSSIGFSFRDEATPHVTIARTHGRVARVPTVPVRALEQSVSEIALMQSLPAEGTTRYQMLSKFVLGEGR